MNLKFIQIPTICLLDKTLNSQDKLLLGAIFTYSEMKNGKCWASNKTLMESCGAKSQRTIRRCLEKLEKLGYINRGYIGDKKRNRTEIICLLEVGKRKIKKMV